MDPQGYSITLAPDGQFVLSYYHDVNRPEMTVVVRMSYSYDEIMRALLWDRQSREMEREYWIS